MTPIPILYAISRMNIGGAQRHLLEVLAHLDRRIFTPVLYCLQARPTDSFLAEARALGVEVLDGCVRGSIRGLCVISPILGLSAELKRRGVRLVHSYLFHANLLGTLAARLAQVPVALASKRSLDTYPRRMDRWACRVGNRLSDRVTVPAEAVKQHVHQEEGCPLEKIVIIPNGIDLNRVDGWADSGWAHTRTHVPSGPLVGTVGRLSQKKGQRDLLEAAAVVLNHVPQTRFLFVGDGPLRAELESRARELGVEGRVRFFGPAEDAPRILFQMDLFVLSSHMEGMPNALIEAMAAGLPVVATDVGGTADVVVNGHTGFLVPPRNPTRLAEAIVTLLKDRERARAMGAAGRARVESHFTTQTMVTRLEALYQELLTGKGVSCGRH